MHPHGQRSLAGHSPWGLSRQEYWGRLPCPPPGDLPNPGIKPRSLVLQTGSLPSKPSGKPKNTGVGSCSLFQRIFPTQGSSLNLPHCRQILYHLSHQGSPGKTCRRPRFNSWIGKIPWRTERLPSSVFLPGKYHGIITTAL